MGHWHLSQRSLGSIYFIIIVREGKEFSNKILAQASLWKWIWPKCLWLKCLWLKYFWPKFFWSKSEVAQKSLAQMWNSPFCETPKLILLYLGYLQPSVGHSTFRVISTFSQHSKWNFLRMSFNGTSPSNWGPKTRAVLLAKSLKLIFAWKQIWEFLVLYFTKRYYLQLLARILTIKLPKKNVIPLIKWFLSCRKYSESLRFL